MQAIVAVDEKWGIGKNGALLFHISADLKRFKQLTLGGTVIYGHKTLETFPGGRPLKGRSNIVLSRDEQLQVPDAVVCHSVAQAAAMVAGKADVFVIGGTSIYNAFLPLCETVHVTKVAADGGADCTFPNLDEDPAWAVAEALPPQQENGLTYQYVTYQRVARG